jgi:EmrB/QacA subfamily drug resistance transporter
MLLLDVTIVTVALPQIADGLDAELSTLQWVLDIYALALASVLLGAGSAADLFGHRRFYLLGIVLFAAASLACGLAPNATVLIIARGAQGVGGAAMFATTLSLLSRIYQGSDRAVAFGVWGAVTGASAAIGPILGGLLTEGLDWRWIFFVNLPVSLLAVVLTLRFMPEFAGDRSRRVDLVGMITFTVFASSITYAVIRANEDGWTSAQTVGLLGGGTFALLLFLLTESRVRHPMLDLRLLRRPAFAGLLSGAFCLQGAAFAYLAYTSIWLQTVHDFSPIRAGGALIPLAVAAFLAAGLSSRATDHMSPRIPVGGGLLLIGAGTLSESFLSAGSSWAALTVGLVVSGLGVGLVNPALSAAALAAAPPERAGMASGALNTARQLGYAFGVAAFGALAVRRMQSVLGDQVPNPHGVAQALSSGGRHGVLARTPADRRPVVDHLLHAAYASGLNYTTFVAAGVAALGALVVVGIVRMPAPADAHQEPTAAGATRPGTADRAAVGLAEGAVR